MRSLASIALLAITPAALAAQLPDPATRALGMGGAYTALARGYEAVAWNPGLLAARGRPGFSLSLPRVAFEFGSNTYGLSDLRRYADEPLTDADKQTLLDMVDTSLTMRAIAGVTPFALQIGPFGLSMGTTGDMTGGFGRDAVELALFGNASRSGPGEFFTAAGSFARGWAASTLAASFAMPIPLSMGRLSVGVTGKRIWGHGLAYGTELSSSFAVNPAFDVQAAGHVIYTEVGDDFNFEGFDVLGGDATNGSGFGVDLGGVLDLTGARNGLRIGVALVNVIGTMNWDESRLRYDRFLFQVAQDASGNVTDTLIHDSLRTEAQINSDPTARALRDSLLEHAGFSKLIRAGVALRLGGFTLGADAQLRLSEGLDRQPAQLVAVGAEYVLLGILPLRAGLATDFSDAFTISGGTGLHLGPVKLDIGASNTGGSDRPGLKLGAGIGLIF